MEAADGDAVLTYVRDRHTVETSMTEDGGPTEHGSITETAIYDAGGDVTVSWEVAPGYQVTSVTVDKQGNASEGSVLFDKLSAKHMVAVEIAPVEYQLYVKFGFSDGSSHGGEYTDYTDQKIYHISDGYQVTVHQAPEGYTLSEASSPSTGNFGAGDVTVTFRNTRNAEATVAVKYGDGVLSGGKAGEGKAKGEDQGKELCGFSGIHGKIAGLAFLPAGRCV